MKAHCPFKYIKKGISCKITKRRKVGFLKYVEDTVSEKTFTEILCKLNHFECVGESKCPIMMYGKLSIF